MIVVSVLMTTYGHAEFIEEAINGVLMQECDFEVELIIADDNSPDDTEDIVDNFINTHPKKNWVKYTKHKINKGMVPNLIWALQEVEGNYIAICEGDDYWTDPLKLQKQIDFLEKNPGFVIAYGDIQPFDQNGIIKDFKSGAKRDLSAMELMKSTPINTQTICFRNVLGKIPNEIYCARIPDLFFWSLLGAHGKGKYLKDLSPTRYRIHDGGIFSKQTEKKKLEMWLITTGALLAYYSRIGDKILSEYFHEKNLIASFQLMGPRPYFKLFFRKGLVKYIFGIHG